jgi:hypothetical protein
MDQMLQRQRLQEGSGAKASSLPRLASQYEDFHPKPMV